METQVKTSKTSKKSLVIFILICLLGFGVGFGTAMAGNRIFDSGFDLSETASAVLMNNWQIFVIAEFLVTVILAVLMLRHFHTAVAKAKTVDMEDEEAIAEIDRHTMSASVIYGVSQVLIFFFMSMTCFIIKNMPEGSGGALLIQLFVLIFSLVMMIVMFVFYKKMLDIEMKANPYRKGDIFSVKFYKQWEESGDEAEKMILYKAGHNSMQAAMYVAYAGEMICFLMMILFNTSVMPCIALFAVILTGQWVFLKEQERLHFKGING